MESKYCSTAEEMKSYIDDNIHYDYDCTHFTEPMLYYFDTKDEECGRCWPRGSCSHTYVYSYTPTQAKNRMLQLIRELNESYEIAREKLQIEYNEICEHLPKGV